MNCGIVNGYDALRRRTTDYEFGVKTISRFRVDGPEDEQDVRIRCRIRDFSCRRRERGAEVVESAEDHRFALEVLQLRIRRDILKFIDEDIRSAEEVAKEFGINERRAAFHLAMLEKALVVERVIGGYRSTLVGLLYIEKVDDR